MTPRLPDAFIARFPDAYAEPAPASARELDAMTALAQARGARTVAIGHSHGAAATAAAFADRWHAAGGLVLATVGWPDTAASWLRHAERFARAEPDLWIVTGTPAGWAQMARRLAWSTPWRPGRTLAFPALATATTLALAGTEVLDGMAGPARGGGTWEVRKGRIEYRAGARP